MSQEDPSKIAAAQAYLSQNEEQIIENIEQKEEEIAKKYSSGNANDGENNKIEPSQEEETELLNARNGVIGVVAAAELTTDSDKDQKGNEEASKDEVIEGEFPDVEKSEVPAVVEKTEKKKKEETLEKELEEIRTGFARKDYEVTTKIDRLKGFFGRSLKTDSKKITDTEELYAQYKDKINEILEFKLEDIQKRLTDAGDDPIKKAEIDKEIKGLILHFHKDEKINLFEARTNARAESRKGKSGETFLKGSLKFINWYRKFDWKAKNDFIDENIENRVVRTALKAIASPKMAISAVLFVGGVGVPVKVIYRILGAAAAGTGATIGLEALSRKIEEAKSDKFAEQLMNESEGSNDKFQNIMNKMKDIDYRDSLHIEQNRSLRRMFAGAAVAGVIGSGAASFGMKKIFELWSGGGSMEVIGKGAPSKPIHPFDSSSYLEDNGTPKMGPTVSPESGSVPEAGTETGGAGVKGGGSTPELGEEFTKPENGYGGVPNPEDDFANPKYAYETPNENVIEVKEGSSFEGTLKEYLNNHKELIDQYNKLDAKGRTFNAGQIAHRMADQFANENSGVPGEKVSGLNLVHEGSKITFNPNTMEVEAFEDEKGFGDFSEKQPSSPVGKVSGEEIPQHEAPSGKVPESAGTNAEAPEKEVAPAPAEKPTIKVTPEPEESKADLTSGQSDATKQPEIKITPEKEAPVTMTPGSEVQGTKVDDLIESREKVINLFRSEGFNSGNPKVDFARYISGDNRQIWADIKDAEFSRGGGSRFAFDRDMSSEIKGKIRNICEALPENSMPKKGVPLSKWVLESAEELDLKKAA